MYLHKIWALAGRTRRCRPPGPDQASGAFLSGGLDSSTVAGVLSEFGPAPARTFLVFFDWNRADLTDRGRQIIAEAEVKERAIAWLPGPMRFATEDAEADETLFGDAPMMANDQDLGDAEQMQDDKPVILPEAA